ncbi:hypothetical protein CO613_00185 [Lysobacteraceae bacterium NML07-0707]|nr:hypothetical protein CO613_00185 [Xanthomonadaceae bacterium NML07-0707]
MTREQYYNERYFARLHRSLFGSTFDFDVFGRPLSDEVAASLDCEEEILMVNLHGSFSSLQVRVFPAPLGVLP